MAAKIAALIAPKEDRDAWLWWGSSRDAHFQADNPQHWPMGREYVILERDGPEGAWVVIREFCGTSTF